MLHRCLEAPPETERVWGGLCRKDKSIQVVTTEGSQKGYCAYRRTALDTSAIEQLGWKPQVSLKEGINRVFQRVLVPIE